MANYSPVFSAGREPITLTASAAAITAGDPLVVAGNGTVAKAAALASPSIIGVAADDALASGRVTVWPRGPVHESVADGTVTAGDQVGSTNTASRQVKTIPVTSTTFAGTYSAADAKAVVDAAVNAARAVLGIALTTAADNAKVRWMQL